MNYYMYKKFGYIILEIWSVWEKAESYEVVGNHFIRIFTLIQSNDFWVFLILWHWEIEN